MELDVQKNGTKHTFGVVFGLEEYECYHFCCEIQKLAYNFQVMAIMKAPWKG